MRTVVRNSFARVAHPECRQSLAEDRRAGLIYGPYAEPTGETVPCSVCHGTGSYGKYADDPVNAPEIRNTDAPCAICRGTGRRDVLRFMSMGEWCTRTNRCAYCGGAFRGRQRTKHAR